MIALSDIKIVANGGTPAWNISLHQDEAWTIAQATNLGEPSRVREVILKEFGPFPADSRFYGEGFQMLSQYTGHLGSPRCLTPYSDRDHYRIPQQGDGHTVYSLLHIEIAAGDHLLLCFSSCHRFAGEFRISPEGTVQAIINLENLAISNGKVITLEEFGLLRGSDADTLYDQLALRLSRNHPPRDLSESPTGWCSWYCYGPDLKQDDIRRNLRAIKDQSLPLQYVQIDDGFQIRMGDWETWSAGFPEGISSLIEDIRCAGLEPAIWLAPFIAEESSDVLRLHPEWFISDENGQPLPSDQPSFGGWRAGPWYCLDGTHPEVQAHLEKMARFFRETYGIRYFKLDALFWGAMHGGRLWNANLTRVEAYRQGMAAFNRGAGEDAYILGCNAAIWPSLGLVNGMRVTSDIMRQGEIIRTLAEEQFFRNWQHGKLWVNDPDCVCLDDGELTFPKKADLLKQGLPPASAEEYHFHAAVILASGGAILSGDDIASLSAENAALLKTLVAGPRKAARFRPFDFSEGSITDDQGTYKLFFNPSDQPHTFVLPEAPDQPWRFLCPDSGAAAPAQLHVPARSAVAVVSER